MKEGHIYTDSQIERGYVDNLKEQIQRVTAKLGSFDKIIHHITSPGGDVYEGYEAYHYLKGLGKPIKSIVEGQCQSIATFIALAGEEVVMLNPSRWMIHEASIPPMSIVRGDADSLEKNVTELRKINSEMAERYAAKTKQSIEVISQQMKKETSMTANEAKQFGFADQVIESLGDMKQYQNLKAVALGKDMEEPKVITMLQAIEAKIEAFFKTSPKANAPVAIDLAGADGKMYNVDSENGDLVGKPIKVDGAPAPDGTIPLADGRSLVCSGGMVTAVEEAMTPEQKEIQQLKSQLQAMQAEKDSALAAKTASEQQAVQLTTAMQDIQKEVTALKKVAVGNQQPVGKGKIQEPKIKQDDNWEDEARKELFQETGINNWLNLKSN